MNDWNLSPQKIENPEGQLKILKNKYASSIYKLYEDQVSENKIINYIEIHLADMFHHKLEK